MNGSTSSTSRDIEQASALLDVTNETELEAFLHELVRSAAGEAGRRISVDAERAVVDAVRRTAEETLPTLATVFGTDAEPAWPHRSAVATAARVYGLELEGLSAEDRDYEIARQFIRLAEATARSAAEGGPTTPAAATGTAVPRAARELARGAIPSRPVMHAPGADSGRWVRRGNAIVLIGLAPDHPRQRP